ncbi:hypothetical protein DQ04_10071000 [Trypanosoma grayi]|uniref:hypothetical protein n=1 Tax=Trypanosoma grayi TaxID=71804 RepID=UPI0004F3F904|nr:hypothetical protein DQ04_10071000 [Trypanosoma grayi]KEG07350.1 hypothetical protein DQ04_10071000 [Trypanosoma grayi]
MVNVPVFVPLFAPLHDKSERKITEVLVRVKGEFDPLPPLFLRAQSSGTCDLPTKQNEERLIAYAFLLSNRWDVEKTMKAIRDMLKFRERYQIDSLLVHPSPFCVRGFDEEDLCARLNIKMRPTVTEREKIVATLCTSLHFGIHFWDKHGIPVAYWLVGKAEVHDTLRKLKQQTPVGKTAADLGKGCAAYALEVGWNICRYQSMRLQERAVPGIAPAEGRLQAVTVVLDASGLGYKDLSRPALELLHEVLWELQAHYADAVNRLLVVNCPRMIMFAYNILKRSLHEGFQKKITFVSPADTPEALDIVIGKERVPSFLGGHCSCPNGCIASYDPNAAFTAEEEDEGDVVTEDINLKPGKTLEKAFELEKGEEVVWEFVSTSGADVRFLVNFYPKTEGISVHPERKRVVIDKSIKKTTKEHPLVHESKLADGADRFCAPQDGVLQLVWDNSRSWVQRRPIQMRVYKNSPLADGSED